jgi:hypothetical protein
MYRGVVMLGSLLAGCLLAAAGSAQEPRDRHGMTDVLLRVNGPIQVPPAEEAATIWVINGEAVVEGHVREQVVVINGTARVSGTVDGSVVVVGGHLDLLAGARVGEDVVLFRSTVVREPGATVTGEMVSRTGFSFSERFLWWFWSAMTLVMVVAALLYVALAERQLREAGELIARRPGGTAAATLAVWLGLPLTALLAAVTVIGIPLAAAVMFFLLPALAFLGYLVSGACLGRVMTGESASPYLAAAAGVLVLQVLGFVPVIGGLVATIAGMAGAGALVLRLWGRWHPHNVPEPVPISA